MYDKALCLCISFPVCLWGSVCGHTLQECACVSVCLNFVFNTLNLSQMSPGKREEKACSYQVKSHGRLTEHSLYHAAAARAWLESKHTWLNMHCPHVHREYIFCITGTQNYGVLLNYRQSNSLQINQGTTLRSSYCAYEELRFHKEFVGIKHFSVGSAFVCSQRRRILTLSYWSQ